MGKDELRSANESLPESIVMQLMSPYLNKGRNVTTNNFFTSASLAQTLKANDMSIDQMARRYSTRAAARRWPVHVFYNILDLAAINAWIIYRGVTGEEMSRHAFLRQIA